MQRRLVHLLEVFLICLTSRLSLLSEAIGSDLPSPADLGLRKICHFRAVGNLRNIIFYASETGDRLRCFLSFICNGFW